MKNISNLIKGLKKIEEIENVETSFNSQNSILYIGDILLYSDEEIEYLGSCGFNVNSSHECFEYNLD